MKSKHGKSGKHAAAETAKTGKRGAAERVPPVGYKHGGMVKGKRGSC